MAPTALPARRYLLAFAAAGLALFALASCGGEGEADSATWTVRRGPLRITVSEGGSLQSLKPVQIASQVEGQAKIISIVPEGTVVTDADVAAGKVLVELDSSDLKQKLNRQQIAETDAESGVAQARAALDIQRKQNESDERKAGLDVRFAELDLDKYLGHRVAQTTFSLPAGASFADLAKAEGLEGEALQSMRKLRADIDLASEEVTRAKDRLAATQRLLEKEYVSKDEEVADRLALKRKEVESEQAKTALDLYLAYEFPKEVEKRLSDVREAREVLARVRAQGASAIVKAEADLKGRTERLALEEDLLERLRFQLASCVIRAQNPGLVVYASSEDDHRGDESPIQEGATVRERQPIIRLPDPKTMGVRVNVHESSMDRVKVGQTATVTIDAFPGKTFEGTVAKLATMPNAQNRWMNPDLKVYTTEVAIKEPPAKLRPGMSARVEILVDEIESCLSVPVQAVAGRAGKPAVWVRGESGDEARAVRVGRSNDRFAEIVEGLREGEVVLLSPPKDTQSQHSPDGRETAPSGRGGRGSSGRGRSGRPGGAGEPAPAEAPESPGAGPGAPKPEGPAAPGAERTAPPAVPPADDARPGPGAGGPPTKPPGGPGARGGGG